MPNAMHLLARLPALSLVMSGCVSAAVADAEGLESADVESSLESKDAVDSVVAMVHEATEAWVESCPEAGEHGLCLHVDSLREDPARCGEPLLGRLVMAERDVDAAAAAQDRFEDALALAEGVERPADPQRLADYRHALGQALLAVADATAEEYFAVRLPAGLDFSQEAPERKQTSEREFASYMKTKTATGQALMTAYAEVKEAGDAESMVTAALRTAWVATEFSDALRSADVPERMRSNDEQRAAYCGALHDFAAGPANIALDAAVYCRDKATEWSYVGPTVSACDELATALSTESAE